MEEAASMQSNSQEFCLRWNNFHSSLVSALDSFKNDSDFVDVTLACEGQFLKAHKMLLSACSVFFRDLLKANPCQHPIVILPPEVRFLDLEKMLRFIYQGEVNVQQEHLARFLKTAEMLKIRGLAEDTEKQKVLRSSSPRPPDTSSDRPTNIEASPKRPRLSVEGQGGSASDESKITSEDSRRSPDSDSEMIPVKQEMVELKESDFDTEAESDVLLTESYLKESPAPTTSSNSSMNLPSQSQPSAPPPPGPLLPSYVPPPQMKTQDESSSTNQEEFSPASNTPAPEEKNVKFERWWAGEGESSVCVEKWSPGQTPKSSISRPTMARGKAWTTGKSPTFLASMPPSPSGVTTENKSPIITTPKDHPSPAGSCPSPSLSSGPSPKESSRSIWHPPSCNETFNFPNKLSSGISILPVTPLSSQQGPFTPISCDICSKTFTSVSNLNKHKRVQHSGEQYLCPICQRRFRSRYYIKDHVNLCAAGVGKRVGQGPSPNSNGEIEEIGACEPNSEFAKRAYGKWKPEVDYSNCLVEKIDKVEILEVEQPRLEIVEVENLPVDNFESPSQHPMPQQPPLHRRKSS